MARASSHWIAYSGKMPLMGMATQLTLIDDLRRFPQTRYQGSKLKLLPWIWEHIATLDFATCLDAFGGTGCVAYLLKTQRKTVTYNDILRSNWIIGEALIENSSAILSSAEVDWLVQRDPGHTYDDFIERTFEGIYFAREEDRWLDVVSQNIGLLGDPYRRALAHYALFQACIIKRPYNLFHRANLYMRTNDVERSFGNKTTWDRAFEDHFRSFAMEASAAVFDSGIKCTAINKDVFEVRPDFELVYIDTPYMNGNGVGPDYFEFYHFLEGLCDYPNWAGRIDRRKKHLPLLSQGKCIWLDKNRVLEAFDKLFEKFRKSLLVISYRTDGIPNPDQLMSLLRRHGKRVANFSTKGYKYVLSSNGVSREALIVAD